MLTAELLSFHRSGRRVVPDFVSRGDLRHRETLEAVAGVYAEAASGSWTRDELAEAVEPLVFGAFDRKFAGAIAKLLEERTKFSAVEECDYPAWRHEVFGRSFASLAGGVSCSREHLLAARGDVPPVRDIYGDLPGSEQVSAFAALSFDDLLDRYNLALVQGLLLHTGELRIIAADPDPAEMRRVFKYMKFFRLLAEAKTGGGAGAVELTVSGPFSLFGPTAKYAMQLAAFFPALVRLRRWSLSADIELRRLHGKLELDESAPLVSFYRNFSAYIPEEIRLFHRHFAAKSDDWEIVGDTPFIDGGDQEIVFPDLSFRSRSGGELCHLELFHRWHRAQLDRRLELLEHRPELSLILGVDRSLADDSAWEELLAGHPKAAERCFRFRDWPGVDTTLRMLERRSNGAVGPLFAKKITQNPR